MSLSAAQIVGFIPCLDMKIAKKFYSERLGLKLINSDDYALEYKIRDTLIRVTKVSQVVSVEYTVLGWRVDNIRATVNDLTASGIEFIQYEMMPQDPMGICVFPGGSKVAWFKDPDGNTLSISQF